MSDQQQADEQLSFEQAMQELEDIVGTLEAGELPLEESLQRFERAVRLSRISQQKLQQAEQKVAVLMQRDNTETLTPADHDQADQ